MNEDFLLQSDTARRLYHEHAEHMPIIDYHCHLNPQMVAEDHRFPTITELWLGGDHYKWRAMRANGIDERFITGDATDWEKFEKWAETVPYCMRNPLYHWTHLELRTAFGITELLNPSTARTIYDRCNETLQTDGFTARGLMRHYNVECVCTTDDPVDSLEHHIATRQSGFEIRMLPSWRPDKALAIEDSVAYRQYIDRLSQVSGIDITDYDALLQALQHRHDFFAEQGCRLSDHGFTAFYADDFTASDIERIFHKVLDGQTPTPEEEGQFKSCLMLDFGRMDAKSGWTQQFHYGPLRNTNSRMMAKLGPDTGFDSMGDTLTAPSMARFLDRLDSENLLAKTIIYPINPSHNDMIATMIGNFQQGPQPGKIQFGSGWWFNDQKDGIERQLNALSCNGLLSRFVGMLTDSRSFLSYPRHEYFRRTLCNLIGNDVENGELPASELPFIGKMVEDICYNNAKRYFKF